MQNNKLTKSALCVGMALASTSVFAASSWLSRVNTIDENQNKQTFSAQNIQSVNVSSTDSSKAIFDITVSLHNNPEGVEQVVYEEIFANFADGICEQTNGAHKLGKVSVFRENKHRSKSDIIWGEREWPRTNASGFGANGMHIWFGDVFPNGASPGVDHDMLNDPLGAGYTLAHEWGHYAYGVFDEYQGTADSGEASTPLNTDVAATSIMSNQWRATQGDMIWLNHSTADSIGDVNRTAQGRVYGKSAWEVLLQDAKDDPKLGRKTAQPNRTRFVTLADNAPDSTTPVKIELPTAQTSCRDQLEVVWVEGDIDMQVVIDRSGSMSGSAIDNAKQAAKILVDATAEGSTSLGLVSFSSNRSVVQDFPIQKIENPDTGVKVSLKASIDAIRSSGSTALYDGSQLALDNLVTYQQNEGSGAPGVVFVLADGDDNSSTRSQSEVIANYQNSNIPIFSFGYGFASPTGPLLTLANETGGKYFSSPTSLAQIVDAFLQANAIATDNQNLASSLLTINSAESATQAIEVDSGLDNINVFVNHNLAATDVELKLLDATGVEVTGVVFECVEAAGTQSCNTNITQADIAAHGLGQWQLQISNVSVNSELKTAVNISAEPSLSGSYTVSVEGFTGNAVTYPEPMIITTAITKDKLITGANVVATITSPSDLTTTLDMFDNGLEGDAVAGDGIYSVIAPYKSNGIYQVEVHVNNNDSAAMYTTTGLLTATLDGSVPTIEALPAITENFVRITKTSLVITDVPRDSDGNDTYTGSDDLATTNAGVTGVVDNAGDIDFYDISGVDTSKDLVVRVADLSLGMKPSLNLYKSDGTTAIKESITLDTNPSKTGYLYYTIDKADLESNIYAAVKHEDVSAVAGGYQISAGEALNTDVAPNNAPAINADNVSVWSGQTKMLSPLNNDTDIDGDTLTIDSINTTNTLATVTLSGDKVIYDASVAFADETQGTIVTDTFKYIATDNNGAFVEGTVTVAVNINSSPEAAVDTVEVKENASVTISALSNDSDIDGHTITLLSYDAALNGQLTDNNDDTWNYSPNGQFDNLKKGETATESFTYTIADELGAQSSAQVTITIVGVNTLPVSVEDTATTTKSETVQVDVLANDTDEDGDVLTVSSFNADNIKGAVTDNGNGTLTYDPAGKFDSLYSGESTTETFTYTVSDGEQQVTTNVVMTITGEGTKPAVPVDNTEPTSRKSSGSLYWFTLLLMPFAALRRRKK